MEDEDRLLTVNEVAELLRCDPHTVRVWIRQGLIESWRGPTPGSHWRVPLSAIAALKRGPREVRPA
jgi:excisionase family DNA binding protein